MKLKNRLFRIFINITAVIYFIFDETFIKLFDKLNELIHKLPSLELILIEIRNTLKKQHRYTLLLVFLTLLVISELLGIVSFIFLAKSNIVLFATLYAIKFIPFFVMSFIFKETKDILLEIKWFNWCYSKVINLIEYLKTTEVYVKVQEVKLIIKTWKFKLF